MHRNYSLQRSADKKIDSVVPRASEWGECAHGVGGERRSTSSPSPVSHSPGCAHVAAFLDMVPTQLTGELLAKIKAPAARDVPEYPIAEVPGVEWEHVVKMLKMYDYPVPERK